MTDWFGVDVYKVIPLPVRETFWDAVEPTGFCWNWLGTRNTRGYGVVSLAGSQYMAHRVAYAILMGGTPPELSLDHLCRNHGCVNPDHVEPVTLGVNTLRGFGFAGQNQRKAECAKGHPLTPDNILPNKDNRSCAICYADYHREYAREAYRADREAGADRARGYRERNRESVNQRARERRAKKKQER